MTLVIDVKGFIDNYTMLPLRERLTNAEAAESVYVNISSEGGDYTEALAAYNLLRQSRRHVTCAAQGFVASAGAVLLLAGDEIEAAENAIIMFHLPQLQVSRPMSAEELEKSAQDMRAVETSLVTTLLARFEKVGKPKTEQEVRDFLAAERWLTPAEALEMGLIDKILSFKRRKLRVKDSAPASILNFVSCNNRRVEEMALRDICTELALQVKDSATEEEMTELILNHVKAIKESPTEEKKAETNVIRNVSVQLAETIAKARALQISALVSARKIVPAVGNELHKLYATAEAVTNALGEDAKLHDMFDATIAALEKNEPVISAQSQTGVQSLPKFSELSNPLIADAERRATATVR